MTDADLHAELDAMAAELIERYEELTLLYDISAALAREFDPEEQCAIACDRAARAVGAYAGEVILDPTGAPPAARAVFEGQPSVLELSDVPALWVPVEASSGDGGVERLGALVLRGGRGFDAGDVKLARTVASQLGSALRAARTVAALRDAALVQQEIELAAAVQQRLLPGAPPVVPGIRLAGRCLAATRVGGDYYDFLVDAEGNLSVVIADVTGHSVASALMMASARTMLRRVRVTGWDPAELLGAVNETMLDDLIASELFITAFVAQLDPVTRRLTYTNAAHNPALLRRAGGEVVELDADGMALGMVDDPGYERQECELGRGDVLVMYTDGVTEARDAGGEQFGERRLHELLAALDGADADKTVQAIFEAVDAHVGHVAQQDDVTVAVVEVAT